MCHGMFTVTTRGEGWGTLRRACGKKVSFLLRLSLTRTPKHLSPETSYFPQPPTVRKGLEKGFVPGAPLKFSGSLGKTLLPKLSIQALPRPQILQAQGLVRSLH